MPDTKITALAAITTVDPAADVLPIVDVSDTSMAASGTTKKITSNQILGAGGTATLASATITGALTVSAGTLALPSLTTAGDTNTGIYFPAADTIGFVEGGVEVMRINSSGNLVVNNAATITGSATAAGLIVTGATIPANGLYLPSANNLGFSYNSTLGMTLNSTGLGVGISPAAKLHIEGSGPQARFSTASATDARHEYYRNGIREGLLYWDANLIGLYATQSSGELVLASANTIRVRINSAGDTISNVTGTAPTLAANSQMVFNLTSNTNLRISVRGSDGVTRTTNLTLT